MEPKIFLPIRQNRVVDEEGIQTLRLNKFFDQVSRNLWEKAYAQSAGSIDYYVVSSTPAVVSVIDSSLTAYQSDNGLWLLDINLTYTVVSAARTGVTLNLTNVKFKNTTGLYQAVNGYAMDGSGAYVERCYAEINTGNIILLHASATTTIYSFNGHGIKLEEKPGFAE